MPSTLLRAIPAALLALAACATPAPSPVATAETRLPEPVRPTARAPAPTPAPAGMVAEVAAGATARFAIDAGVRISNPQGTGGEVDADAILAETRTLLAALRFRAENGGVTVEGPQPFAGRARAQRTGAVLRFSLASPAVDGGERGVLTAEVRGDSITGRVARRSAAEDAERTRSAFFAGRLKRE